MPFPPHNAPFDTTCDLWTGPGDTPPNHLYYTGPCRLVRNERFQIAFGPGIPRGYYLTHSGSASLGPRLTDSAGRLLVDYGFAARVAVPAGSAPRFVVLYMEVAWSPVFFPNYFRANLALIGSIPYW